MTIKEKQKIQRDTVKKTLALLEKKNLLKKKSLKEGALPMAKSSSEAQQHYIELITNALADNFDDLEDYANMVAALKKVTQVVIKDGSDWASKFNEPGFLDMISAAEKDWRGQTKRSPYSNNDADAA
jgi:hypothetical protein